jgi:hypothetical protein
MDSPSSRRRGSRRRARNRPDRWRRTGTLGDAQKSPFHCRWGKEKGPGSFCFSITSLSYHLLPRIMRASQIMIGTNCTFLYTMNTICRHETNMTILQCQNVAHSPPMLPSETLINNRQSPSKCDSIENRDNCVFILFWLSFALIYFPWTCLPSPFACAWCPMSMTRWGMQWKTPTGGQRQAHVRTSAKKPRIIMEHG